MSAELLSSFLDRYLDDAVLQAQFGGRISEALAKSLIKRAAERMRADSSTDLIAWFEGELSRTPEDWASTNDNVVAFPRS
jgi:hypothetical protein